MAKAVSKAKFDDVTYGAKTNSNLKGAKFKRMVSCILERQKMFRNALMSIWTPLIRRPIP